MYSTVLNGEDDAEKYHTCIAFKWDGAGWWLVAQIKQHYTYYNLFIIYTLRSTHTHAFNRAQAKQ